MTADLLDAPASRPATAAGGARPRSTGRRRVLAVTGLAATVGLAALVVSLGRGGTGDGVDQSGYAPQVTLPPVADGAPTQFAEVSGRVAAPAPSPAEAVRRFLDAEIAGDFTTSFAQLSAADRNAYGTADDWAAGHDELPQYQGYARPTGDGAEVVVEVTLTPTVDTTAGVVPAGATATFVTVEEDGGYRLALDALRLRGHYPSDADAPAAAVAWITLHQTCTPIADDASYEGTLLGDLGLAERLCSVAGSPVASAASPLDALADPTFVLSAFGGEASTWARVVRVTGLGGVEPIDVVLAPFGDEWVVVGAVGAA